MIVLLHAFAHIYLAGRQATKEKVGTHRHTHTHRGGEVKNVIANSMALTRGPGDGR